MYTVSVEEILNWKTKQLNYGGEEEALFLLLDTVAGLSKKDFNCYKINFDQTICLKKSVDHITRLWVEHIDTSRPIQQICGSAFWRDLKIRVTNDVLIPRPETELIVDIVNDLFRFSEKELDFVDLGTGSGIIAISLAQYNPTWRGFATEVNEKALEIAKYNCMKLHKSSNLKFSLIFFLTLFLQVQVDKSLVSDTQNCGNILAGIAPFSIERGLVKPKPDHDETSIRIYMENTSQVAIAKKLGVSLEDYAKQVAMLGRS